MDTNSSVADVPSMKLAKVGKGREKKRGGAGWFSGARGAGSAFMGAADGSGMAGAAGMSLGKILTILAVSGGISAGAWQVGSHIAAGSAAAPAAPKIFDSKDAQKYADTSGVIKQDNSIPNSLGYVNNDGLTDAQRAAKKAADAAAAAKAAADAQAAADAKAKADAAAQAKADADAKAKADADAKAASSSNGADAPDALKKALTPGKFGGMSSSFGGGGGGLSGGAGLSGGINRSFGGTGGLGNKSLGGALAAFRSPSRAATSRAGRQGSVHSNSKGFAKKQLDNTNALSRSALASGKEETASAGAAAPFDNNPNKGTIISGPGVGSGTQSGPADSGGSTNMNSNTGGPVGTGNGSVAACPDANYEPDINGNCTSQIQTPTAKNAAPYQGLIDAVMAIMAIVAVLSMAQLYLAQTGFGAAAVPIIGKIIGVLGLVIAGMGAAIIAMSGDIMIGGIVTAIGLFIGAVGFIPGILGSTETFTMDAASTLIASAVGMMAGASKMGGSMM